MYRLSNCLVCLSLYFGLAIAPKPAATAAEPVPYEARVVTAGAPVRSGPGEGFYLTDTLAEGQTVEVHQERPDGWCAIRPPETSFSWVFVRHVAPVGNGLGRINKDGAPSRVGSNLSSHREVAQVELHEGEIVRVIDEETHDGQSWYKIAPPAGEFRWIHVSGIRREGGSYEEATDADAAWRPMARANQQLLNATADADDADVHLASSQLGNAAEGGPNSATDEAAQSTPAAPVLPEEFERRLIDLELRLSRMVAGPSGTWDVGQLKNDANRLMSQADTSDEREAVQNTLAKIDRFGMIQRRQALSGGSGALVAQNSATTPIGTPDRPSAPQTGSERASDASQFDAVGTLRPVVSRRPGAPQFALVDERGQVVSFVTPSPDVNLQPYLGRRVGVVGTRGFMPEYRRNHVVAGRVSPLESNLVR